MGWKGRHLEISYFPLKGCHLTSLDNFIVTLGFDRRLSFAWEANSLHLHNRAQSLHEVDLEDKASYLSE